MAGTQSYNAEQVKLETVRSMYSGARGITPCDETGDHRSVAAYTLNQTECYAHAATQWYIKGAARQTINPIATPATATQSGTCNNHCHSI